MEDSLPRESSTVLHSFIILSITNGAKSKCGAASSRLDGRYQGMNLIMFLHCLDRSLDKVDTETYCLSGKLFNLCNQILAISSMMSAVLQFSFLFVQSLLIQIPLCNYAALRILMFVSRVSMNNA